MRALDMQVKSYPTRDGKWMALSGAGEQPFVRLCEAIEAPDAPQDPRFATMAARLQNRAAADALVRAWIATHDVRLTLGPARGERTPGACRGTSEGKGHSWRGLFREEEGRAYF